MSWVWLAVIRMTKRSTVLMAVVVVLATSCTDGGGGRKSGETEDGTTSGSLYTGPAAQGQPHPLGLKFDLQRVKQFAPYLRQMSGGATFYELVWCDVERDKGERKWVRADQVADLSKQLGYRLYLKIRVGSCWATGGRVGEERGKKEKTASGMPVELAEYRSFVRAVVERYSPKGVHDYAVENEVNAPVFWSGTSEDYASLVQNASGEIREADPDARVFDSGVSSSAYGLGIAARMLEAGRPDDAIQAYNRYYERRFEVRGRDFPRVATATELRSVLSEDESRRHLQFLDTSIGLATRGITDAYQLHFYERWDNVPDLLELLRQRLPPDMAIEAWEVGMFWPEGPGNDVTQAEETGKLVSSLLSAGVARVIYLPTAYDEGSRRPKEIRWGLLAPSGSARPAASVFAALAGAAAGGAEPKAVASGRLNGIILARPDQSFLLVWSDTGTVLRKPATGQTKASNVVGAELSWPQEGLSVDEAPVLISLEGGIGPALQLVE